MRKILLILLALTASMRLFAQPRFGNERGSLSYRNYEMMLNPGYTGSNEGSHKIHIGMRGQWLDVERSPKSQSIQYQTAVGANGIGAWLHHESYGVTSNVELNLSYAHKVALEKGKLSLGLRLGVLTIGEAMVRRLDEDNDPAFASASSRLWGFNAGVGAYYYTGTYFIGLSVPQLLTNDWRGEGENLALNNIVAFNRMQYYLTGGYVFELSPTLQLIPTGLLQVSGATSVGYEALLSLSYSNIFRVGAGIAAGSAIRGEISVNLGRHFAIGYRYEQHLGSTYKNFSASHLVSLAIAWGKVAAGNPAGLF